MPVMHFLTLQLSSSTAAGYARKLALCTVAEAALCMDAVGPAAEHAHGAIGLPVVLDCWLVPEPASALNDGHRVGASDVLEGPPATEAAFVMNAISQATHLAIVASLVEVIRGGRLVLEGALVHDTRDARVYPAATAKSATLILAVCKAAESLVHARAIRFPVIAHAKRLAVELASQFGPPSPDLGAIDAVVIAKTALAIDPIRPASDHAHGACFVPVVRSLRLHDEVALPVIGRHGELPAHLHEEVLLFCGSIRRASSTRGAVGTHCFRRGSRDEAEGKRHNRSGCHLYTPESGQGTAMFWRGTSEACERALSQNGLS
eukprot:CAMPEP_0183504480 /NCGR_PEP_ID=MMETSP0371-20130417/5880_1 /TAXON_ID=268820 /ORGANISM="Peridinium aciculiferum, Strain PAER-2" /LENGTH=318 /DNA_ID=CAMNT_0025699851 /DNA_START=192 /DNA_END=1145 /DNA_ORIENTATION=+